MKKNTNHPIPRELLDTIDSIGKYKNGHIVLNIISSGYLDDSSETEEILINKIQNYLTYINSQEFQEEFGKPSPQRTSIKLICTQEPSDFIYDLVKKLNESSVNFGATIALTIQ
jgi:hypothetical protein